MMPATDDGKIDLVVNNFIKKRLPDLYPHLVDSDENDGQALRDALYIIVREARIDESNGYSHGGSEWTSNETLEAEGYENGDSHLRELYLKKEIAEIQGEEFDLKEHL